MRGADEVIKEVLKEGPKKTKELYNECVDKKGLSKDTYYRHLKKLISLGEVKDAKYKLIEKEREANPKEVIECMKRLKETRDKDLLKIISSDFVRLCDSKRVSHIPNVLSFLESSLEDPKFKPTKVLKNYIKSLYSILYYEKRRRSPKEDIIKRIVENLGKIRAILEESTDPEIIEESLYFLSETEKEEAVNIILDLAMRLPEDVYHNIKTSIERSLFSPGWPIYEAHHKAINEKIYDMINNTDLSIKGRGKQLEIAKHKLRAYA